MNSAWLYKPMIFAGRRINLIFAAIASIPVWLATNLYLNGLLVQDVEAASTGVTISFFGGVFTGRYVAAEFVLKRNYKARRLVSALSLFIIACLCWLFIHADFPVKGRLGINLMLFFIPFTAMSAGIGILIKTVRTSVQNELSEARISAEQSRSELQLLQSQLSPHFLFNTLNNLYGLSLMQQERVPQLLLRLSELLRYGVYETNELFVALEHELRYINNYIEFEKIRLGERLVLKADLEVSDGQHIKIAPMLLIVFIENAFKHAKNTIDERIFIEISLKTWGELLLFSVQNSHLKEDQTKDQNSGLGLQNVRKRLSLLYKDEYVLDISEDDHSYCVRLRLRQKK